MCPIEITTFFIQLGALLPGVGWLAIRKDGLSWCCMHDQLLHLYSDPYHYRNAIVSRRGKGVVAE